MDNRQGVHPLVRQFAQTLDAQGMAAQGSTVLVAVSGGADSVALLRLFCAVRDRRRLTLHAAHLHHGIRGQDATEDADFVSALCHALEVPCTLGKADVPALRRQLGTGLEDAARQARRGFLQDVAQRIGAATIALAHHMDDQAETVLLHLLRGCGLQGLTGMRPMQGPFIRPLLDIPKAALCAYLTDLRQPWREDATNADTALTRNALRHRVLPVMTELNPGLVSGLHDLAERLRLDEDCLQTLAAALPPWHTTAYGGCASLAPYQAAHEALRRRGVRDGLARLGVRDCQADHVQAVSALVDQAPGAVCNLPQGHHALRGRRHLHLLRPHWEKALPSACSETRLCLQGETLPPGGGRLFARPAEPGEWGDGIRTQALDAAALIGAVVRNRRPGDVFHPLGASGGHLLKQAYIDGGIDRPFRPWVPLIAKGSEILWILGMMPSHKARVTPHTTQAIFLTYQGDLPWTE